MNEIKSKGFLLKTIQTQEADVLVKILLQSGEKITAYARAALKSKKRFEGGLPILSQIEFRAVKKPGQDLYVLEDTKIKYEFKNLSSSIESLTMASYFAEITESCAHEGLDNPDLYNLLGASLKALDEGQSPWLVSSPFEVKLLSLMGWLPDFAQLDNECEEILRNILKKKVSENDLKLEQVHKVDGILKNLVRNHLGDGKIKSLDFFRSLRRFQEQNMVTNPQNDGDDN